MLSVGSTTNPHGVKGLENCHFLKSIDDARNIRNRILQNLERACLPTTNDQERRRLLSFVVSGGGPTGVEFAAELFDMLNEDLLRSFPKILRNEISVHVIQSRGHILNTYDEALSKYAEARFAHDQVEVLTNSRVKEVRPDKILFTQKDENGESVTKELPMGFCLWSTGVGKSVISCPSSAIPCPKSLSLDMWHPVCHHWFSIIAFLFSPIQYDHTDRLRLILSANGLLQIARQRPRLHANQQTRA